MSRRSTPAHPKLVARIQAALDSGLTQTEFVRLIPNGRVSQSIVGRALGGDPLVERTLRSLERCCLEFEAGNVMVTPRLPPKMSPPKIAPKVVRVEEPVPEVAKKEPMNKADNALAMAEEFLADSSHDKRLAALYHVYQARRILRAARA